MAITLLCVFSVRRAFALLALHYLIHYLNLTDAKSIVMNSRYKSTISPQHVSLSVNLI